MPLLFCSSLRPLVVFVSRCVFFVGGFHWLTVKGEQHTAKEAPIIALAPHSSFLDALVIVYLNLSTVVAKQETSRAPVLGSMFLWKLLFVLFLLTFHLVSKKWPSKFLFWWPPKIITLSVVLYIQGYQNLIYFYFIILLHNSLLIYVVNPRDSMLIKTVCFILWVLNILLRFWINIVSKFTIL